MVPAQHGFKRDDLVLRDIDDRLVNQAHLVIRQCVAQILLDLPPAFGIALQIRGIEAELAAPATLCRIKGKVRAANQLLAVHPVIRGNGDTHGGADRAAAAQGHERLREHRDDLLGDFTKIAAIVHVGQDHLEFVAAQTPDLAILGNDPLQALRHLLEQIVTGRVPQRVVHLLEAIEIQHHQGAAALRCDIGRKRRFEALFHAVPVGKAGKRIVLGEVRRVAQALAAFRDIGPVAAIADELAGFRKAGPARNRPPCFLLAFRGAHDQAGKAFACVQQQGKRALGRIRSLTLDCKERVERQFGQFRAGLA